MGSVWWFAACIVGIATAMMFGIWQKDPNAFWFAAMLFAFIKVAILEPLDKIVSQRDEEKVP